MRERGGHFEGGEASRRAPGGGALLIETPENVDFTVEPAGIGLRALAYAVDLIARSAPVLALVIVLSITGKLSGVALMGGFGIALIIILFFALQWAYYVLFEFFWNGRTPGKRVMKIRVVMDGGYPVTFLAASVRNLVRLVDSLPSFYGIGITAAFAGRRNKRLGDIAAGTMVVKEEPFDVRYLAVIEAASEPGPRPAGESLRLSPREIDLLARFIERRETFDPHTREELAGRIASGVHAKAKGASTTLDGLFERGAFGEYIEQALRSAEGSAPLRGDVGVHRFVKERKEDWVRLAGYVERIDAAGFKWLGAESLRDVTRLYRAAAGDLAYAKTFFGATELTRFVNALVGRAHNHIYRAPPASRFGVLEFYRRGFPAAYRRNYAHIALARYVLAAFVVFGAVLFALDERTAALFLGEEAVESVRQHELWTRDIFSVVPKSIAAAGILTNNIGVTFATFALGITAALGTFYLLGLNGVMLGSVFMLAGAYGMSYDLWSFVGAHGFIEIFIITVAGGAGLRMGLALLAPGDLPRLESLNEGAREGVLLVLGGAPVLVIAALIEGYISPQEWIPGWLKIIFGAALLLALLAYLARPEAARKEP